MQNYIVITLKYRFMDDNKKQILTDEELMEVSGGKKITRVDMIQKKILYCRAQIPAPKCAAAQDCAWINGGCYPDPDIYEYKI